MPQSRLLSAILLAALAVSAGCVDLKVVVNVEKDGSGTIETVLYSKAIDLPGGGPGIKVSETGGQTKEKAEQAAKAMGEGVTLKSFEELPPREKWKGHKAVYAFIDIAKVRLNPMAGAGPAVPTAEDQAVRFEFQKGDKPHLIVLVPSMKAPESPGGKEMSMEGPQAAMMQAMMAPMLEGARMEVALHVNGKIGQTNASYVSPSRQFVGLMRLDLGGLFKDPAALTEMTALGKLKDAEAIREKFKGSVMSKYCLQEMQEKVEIEFE